MKEICVEFERKKQHSIGFPTFKLPSSTNNLLWLIELFFSFTISVFEYMY